MSEPQHESPTGRSSDPTRPAPPEDTWLRTSWRIIMATQVFDPTTWQVKRLARRVLVMALVIVLIGIARHGVVRINENQVGVLVNNLTGSLNLRPRAGYHLFVPYLARMYRFDMTIQRLPLTWSQRAASPRDVKLKVADGSEVSLDLTVEFKLRPEMAAHVLRRSGRDNRFAELWMEGLVRHQALTTFGRLMMEDLYDADQRTVQSQAILEAMNTQLHPEGIEIIAVIPGEYRFYREYEQVIEQKKLADQQVEEQQSQARAAQEDQERRIVEKRNELQARSSSFRAEMAARVAQMEAEVEKKKREAEAQYARARLQADSALYAATQQAEATLARGQAEAEGLAQSRAAMQGEGGLNMVALEYARRLQHMQITGTPITRDPAVRQFAVEADEAAATRGGRP